MSEPREIEIKLELDPAEARSLMANKILRAASRSRAKRLISVYFDTPDRALRAAGLTLRIRQVGRGHVQTVKAGASSAGLFDRLEYEEAVAGDRPDERALRKTPAWKALKRAGFAQLEPVFASIVERKPYRVLHGESEIEVVIDRGTIEAGTRSREVCELELELKRGTSADLFALAARLGETVGLRPAAASKSDRGYALLDGRDDKPVKAARVALATDFTAAEGFRAVARACMTQLVLNEALVIRQRHTEGLHQIRVAIRRLRSAISLFGDLVSGSERDRMAAGLKKISEPLGRARNLDVFLAKTLPAERKARPDEFGLDELAARTHADREAAYDAVIAALTSGEWRRLLLDLVRWVEIGDWAQETDPDSVARREMALQAFAAETLGSRWRKVKRKGRRLDRLEPEVRHKVRIQAKKLRYAAEFFQDLYGADKKSRRRHKSFVSTLEGLQSSLGDLNDIAAGHGLAADLASHAGENGAAASFAAGIVAADGDARSGSLLSAAGKAHARLVRAKPFWT